MYSSGIGNGTQIMPVHMTYLKTPELDELGFCHYPDMVLAYVPSWLGPPVLSDEQKFKLGTYIVNSEFDMAWVNNDVNFYNKIIPFVAQNFSSFDNKRFHRKTGYQFNCEVNLVRLYLPTT